MIVSASPRIHLGLVDLSGVSLRRYGGAGIALKGPRIEVELTKAPSAVITEADRLEVETRRDIEGLLSRLKDSDRDTGAQITIKSIPPQHVGLGTKTALLLSVLTGLNQLLRLDLDAKTMQLLSGRGGTSGVGVYTFFLGGMVVDAGQRQEGGFRPSGAATGHAIPVLQNRVSFPEQWAVTLILPPGERRHGKSEREFFISSTPIPPSESYRTFAALYHGVLPAVSLQNLDLLREALKEISASGFKSIEIAGQSANVRSLLRRLESISDAACGMSSMGPLIFCIHELDDAHTIARCGAAAEHEGAIVLGTWQANNAGAEVRE